MASANEVQDYADYAKATSDDVGLSGVGINMEAKRNSVLGHSLIFSKVSDLPLAPKFHHENGRRYHPDAETKYPVPNDKIEADRLRVQHQVFHHSLDSKLHRAPITEHVQNVLDVGCGTGLWSIEFANMYPSARVVGADLSSIQPTQVPPNCHFLTADCDEDWKFGLQFDYVHTRAMVAAFKNWDRFFMQAFNNLVSGGYVESQEPTFPVQCMEKDVTAANSPLIRWSDLFIEAASKTGLDATGPHHLGPKFSAAGFVDVNLKMNKWPVGTWAKGGKLALVGQYMYEDLMEWLSSSSLGLFTRVLEWTREEVEAFLDECRAEAARKDRHYYFDALCWYARKPSDDCHGDDEPVREDEPIELSDEAVKQLTVSTSSPS